MSTARLLTIWFLLACVLGGVVGLMLIEPGGAPSSGAEEFGRSVLAPFTVGAGVAVLLSAPIAVCIAVVRDWRIRKTT